MSGLESDLKNHFPSVSVSLRKHLFEAQTHLRCTAGRDSKVLVQVTGHETISARAARYNT